MSLIVKTSSSSSFLSFVFGFNTMGRVLLLDSLNRGQLYVGTLTYTTYDVDMGTLSCDVDVGTLPMMLM